MEIKLSDSGQLSKVHAFQLVREHEGTIDIEVHEILCGESKGKYFTEPKQLIRYALEEYHYEGPSVEDALNGCLKLIQGKSFKEIFPHT